MQFNSVLLFYILQSSYSVQKFAGRPMSIAMLTRKLTELYFPLPILRLLPLTFQMTGWINCDLYE